MSGNEEIGMPSYEFTLIVEGPDLQTDARIDALYEAGCDDALVGRSHGVQYLDFDRDALSLEDAVLSAISNVESIEGAEVVRIAGAGLVSMADIAASTGRTRESVRLLVEGERGAGSFPAPVNDPRSRYRLWRSSEVRRWFEVQYGSSPELDFEALVAINASLDLRRHCRSLSPERRAALRELVGL
ncbi:MAG: DNA-binding protein [Chloroflexi bacterium]|nr:DNA-binding protein [Chloroflexota bacterium]